MANLPQEQRKQRLIQSKPSEKGEIISSLSQMGDVLHDVFERGEVILALVTIYAIRNSHQPHIMEREKLFGQLADLDVIAAQPGQVFDEHRRDIPGFDCLDHFLKTRTLHGGACDAIVHEKDRVRISLVLGGLLQYLFLIADAVGLVVHVIVTAQAAIKSGCAEGDFLT